MIHNGPEGQRVFVDGYFVPQATDEEDARLQVIALLKPAIKRGPLFNKDKYKQHLYSLEHPDEVNTRGSKLCEIREYLKPVCCGYWLNPPGSEEHLCNTLR